MNKGLIITGAENSGKSMLAKWISGLYGKENTIWVDGHAPFLSREVNKQMSYHPDGGLIIVDEIKYVDEIESLLTITTDGLTVHPQGRGSFHIPPEKLRIILTVQHRLKDVEILHSESVLRRFEIIDVETCGYIIEQARRRQLPSENSSQNN